MDCRPALCLTLFSILFVHFFYLLFIISAFRRVVVQFFLNYFLFYTSVGRELLARCALCDEWSVSEKKTTTLGCKFARVCVCVYVSVSMCVLLAVVCFNMGSITKIRLASFFWVA